MSIRDLIKKSVGYFLYATGLIGAMATAFGITQAVFSDKLVEVVSLHGNPCNPGSEVLERWEERVSKNTGEFIYLDADILEDPASCDTLPTGAYPFMAEGESAEELYHIPLEQPIMANYMPYLEIPVSDAAESLLVNGFLDFENDGNLMGNGVFFVDVLDNPHTGPLYRLVPAPYSIETHQILKCTASFHNASGFPARALVFMKNCVISS